MDRMFWAFLGAVLAIAVISAVGLVSAHSNTNTNNTNNNAASSASTNGVQQCAIHSSSMQMHNMECMELGIEKMDSDGDGFCDYCGMSIEECSEMQGMHENFGSMQSMHARMHNNTGNDGFGMHCGMASNSGMQCGNDSGEGHCGMMSQREDSGSNAGSMTCGMNNGGVHSHGMMGMHSMMH